MLKIVTDGSVDMPACWADDFDIAVLPLAITFGNQIFVQGKDITQADFYRLVNEKHQLPKTSLPSLQQVSDFYKRVAAKGDEILSIHVGSKLSGTFSVFQAAAAELSQDYRFALFNSGAGSAAIGFMCREARLLQRQGRSLAEILARLYEIRSQLLIAFTLENLEFALMSGRISRIQAVFSSLLKINPIIVLKNGLLGVAEKVSTRQKALDKLVSLAGERIGSRKAYLAVVHATAPEAANALRSRIEQAFSNFFDIQVLELGIPVACHLGPGAIGIVAIPNDFKD